MYLCKVMDRKLFLGLTMACCSLAWGQPKTYVAKFDGNRACAISYTFDDGLLEHYTLVRPQLNALGLKASFCIIGSKVGKDQKGTPCMTWEQLKEMAAEGHEKTNLPFTTKKGQTIFRFDPFGDVIKIKSSTTSQKH